jgi:hypothetical protein
MEAISNAGAAIGLLAKDGVVLAAEKRITSKASCIAWSFASRTICSSIIFGSTWCWQLLDGRLTLQLLDTNAVGVRREKMYKLDDHIACAVAGLTGTGTLIYDIEKFQHLTYYALTGLEYGSSARPIQAIPGDSNAKVELAVLEIRSAEEVCVGEFICHLNSDQLFQQDQPPTLGPSISDTYRRVLVLSESGQNI